MQLRMPHIQHSSICISLSHSVCLYLTLSLSLSLSLYVSVSRWVCLWILASILSNSCSCLFPSHITLSSFSIFNSLPLFVGIFAFSLTCTFLILSYSFFVFLFCFLSFCLYFFHFKTFFSILWSNKLLSFLFLVFKNILFWANSFKYGHSTKPKIAIKYQISNFKYKNLVAKIFFHSIATLRWENLLFYKKKLLLDSYMSLKT